MSYFHFYSLVHWNQKLIIYHSIVTVVQCCVCLSVHSRYFFSTWLPVIYACFYLFTSHFLFVTTLLLTIFSHFSALSADFYYFYTFQVAMHMIPLSLTGATNLRGGFREDFRDDIRDENWRVFSNFTIFNWWFLFTIPLRQKSKWRWINKSLKIINLSIETAFIELNPGSKKRLICFT